MKIIKWLLGIVAGLIVAVLIVSLFMPVTLEVERSATVNASRAEVFRTLTDMREFNRFSPWHGIDPATKYTYEGPATGVGAAMNWQSDHPQVGNGWMRIADISGMDKIDIELGFDGFEGKSQSWYLLREVEGGTEVTWGYAGDISKPYFVRLMGPMIQGQLTGLYDEGLARLKTVMEPG